MRIVLIEPDSVTAKLVTAILTAADFAVITASSEILAVELAREGNIDLIIMEPHGRRSMLDYGALRALRAASIGTPVIILSCLNAVPQIVRGLALGADDYMGKPFHRDELVARVRAVLRRSQRAADATIAVGDLAVNLDTKCAAIAGEYVHLTGKEYEVLEMLMRRKGKIVSKETAHELLYHGQPGAQLKIVDVFVCKLRKKLGDAGKCIENVWGRGYRIIDPAAAGDERARRLQLQDDVAVAADAIASVRPHAIGARLI